MAARHAFLCCLFATAVLGGWADRTAVSAPSPKPRGTRVPQKLLQDLQESHRRRTAELHKALDKLVEHCESNGLTDGAETIRARMAPPETRRIAAHTLPTTLQPEIPATLPAEERYWRVQLRDAEQKYAKDTYLLSRQALHGGFAGFAYELVGDVVRHDPDHKQARTILGYERFGNEWVTPFAAGQLRDRKVWDDRFGWLPKDHAERYGKGERFYQGKWMTAAKEAEIRREWRNAWEVRTDHYLIKTNHSLERGVELAAELERFHDFFRQTFAGFFDTPEHLAKVFDGTAQRATVTKPYDVHYYRTRAEYNERLRPIIPQIGITQGLYLTRQRVAHFFDDPEAQNLPTLYHEATHQLFYEASPSYRDIGDQANFWIIEGIACYLESFERRGDELSLGDPNYIRFAAARHRYLVDGYYLPLDKFSAMGMRDFQAHERLSWNYSQASGLAHFLMHYDNGRYREALVRHLSQMYSADRRIRDRVESLAELTGQTFEQLDAQYGEFVKQQQAALTAPVEETAP